MSEFYESDKAVSEYLLFHYGSALEILPYEFGPANALHFPARTVSEQLDVAKLPAGARALDLGCAVGRSTFELAKHCSEVIGIDFSHAFIAAGDRLKEQGSLPYAFAEEGELTNNATANIDATIERSRVSFEQGDAMNLRADLGQFDVVVAANLLCRLTEPMKLLMRLPKLVKPGGQLIFTTPCTWLAEYTPRACWLGGFEQNGKPARTLDTLKLILEDNFAFQSAKDMPFLIREHARKFQWSVAQGSSWVRKG